MEGRAATTPLPRYSAGRSTGSSDTSAGKSAAHKHLIEDIPAEDTDGVPQLVPEEDDEAKGGISQWTGLLNREFGWHFLMFLSCSQHVTKGFVNKLGELPFQYMMRDYGIDAARFGVFEGVVGLPWALKPAMGVMADCFPIYGYSRIPYILFATIVGVGAAWGIATVQKALSIEALIGLLFACSFYVSMIDLLSEALYAKSLREKPASGPRLMSFVWGGMYIAGIFAVLVAGGLLSVTSPYVVFGVAAPFASLILYPTVMNWAGDPKLTDAQQAIQRERVLSQKSVVALAFVMLTSTLVLSFTGMNLSVQHNAIVSLIVGVVVLTSFTLVLNPLIAKVNAFSMIQAALSLSLGGSSFYFMTDTPAQFPDGPHFSKNFYNIVLPVTGSFFSVVGIWLYNQYSHNMTYQRMYIAGNLIGAVVNGIDCIFYARLNVSMGIDDHVFVLGASTLQSVIMNWLWLPSVVIMSQLCPKGMEAIMYANLAGCHNLGSTFSKNFGALLLEYMHVTPSGANGEGGMFVDMWKISLLATMLPLLPVVLVPWFIPDKTATEPILDHDMLPNEGSPLQRWGIDSLPPQARDTSSSSTIIGAPVNREGVA
jgi:MFS family permease